MAFLLVIIIILAAAYLMGNLAQLIKLPAVIGQLLAGIIIGPGVLNWVQSSSSIQHLADLGVICLMFLAGLNSNLDLLKRYLTPSLTIAVLGITMPMLFITWLGLMIQWPLKDALFLGVIFSATSVSITVAVLSELGKLNGRIGTIILGAAVADDVLTVILLGLVVTFTGERLNGQITAGLNPGLILLMQVSYFIVIYLVMKVGLNQLFRFIQRFKFAYANATVALLIGLTFALIAELIGLSAITGAFFAGLIISRTKVKKSLNRQISALTYLLLVPIFFISIGLAMKWNGIIDQWPLFLALTGLAIVTKLVGAGLGSKLFGFNWTDSLIIGAGMVSRGEVALIVAQIVFANQLLNVDQYSAIVGAIIVTTVLSPLIIKLSYSIK
ncbi:cation:proton antiporter [Nicoliella lavandulae]|uniref:Cation:proton antiporter n=1 Tax=Nicoliella lavandulae TaxID=3082954 RepID=A0ABU8SK67_9LACO